jgi:RND superfamily putative drug exporter
VLERFGHFIVRRRRRVFVATAIFFVLAGVFGGNVADHLKAGGFDSPDVESERAAAVLRREFKQAPPNFLLLVTAKTGTVNEDPARRVGVELTNELSSEPSIGQILSHWSLGPRSPLQSRNGTKAIIVAEIEGDDAERNEVAARLIPKYTRDDAAVSVRVGGFEAIFDEVSRQIEKDLGRGESIAVPITLILLIVVFGSVVAAFLPIGIGVLAIIGTFLVLRVIASLTDVSVFALSMVTAMGLGLAIDYSLFIVSRFREEMRKGVDTETAIVTTMHTAGRTVIFSAITVALSLSALLVFPLYFFKSFGYAGIGVVLTAGASAVVFLPAVLAWLGPRVDRWALWSRHPKEVGEGFWHRLAVLVMKRPVPIALGVVVVLLALGAPFLHVNLGLPDERVLPPSAETRKVHDTLRREFPGEEVQSTRVVVTDINPAQRRTDLAGFAAGLSRFEGVDRVDSFVGRYSHGRQIVPPTPLDGRYAAQDGAWFQVVPSVDPFSKQAEELVKDIRAAHAPFDFIVGGGSAQLVDAKASLFSRLPYALGLIAIATFVMLFLMFGSLLVPAKALVLNLLSLTATFGAMVWIFQDGHLSGALDFTSTGTLDISSPILMFCIAFGLSMDFEVFMLSRIKEEYDATGDNERSVAYGLERTGRIVTAAALLISVTFLSFGLSSVRFIKLFGIGMTLAVLMDAFVIRGTLVPAFMRLAGNANWWLPRFLRPLHAMVHIGEVSEVHAPVVRRKPAPRKKAAARKPAGRKNHRKPAAKRKSPGRKKAAR